nr:RagB/SusD family nutrient uptake outer membrane protein [uncultured Draconibacterium sp.]
MKNKILLSIILISILSIAFTACDNILEEFPKDQYSENSIRQDKETMIRVLYGAYNNQVEQTHTRFTRHDLTTDYMWQKFGGFNNQTQIYQDFIWTSLHSFLQDNYRKKYRGINAANLVLDNIEFNNEFSDEDKIQIIAEARFCRAFLYYQLYDEFGPVPLMTSSELPDYEIPRAGEEEMVAFIENELTEAAEDLPLNQELFGRATKGSALGILTKFLLNQKRWSESAEIAKEIIDMGIYELYPDYVELFAVSSEPNTKEFIYAWNLSVEGGYTHFYLGDAYPPNYAGTPDGVLVTAAQWYVNDWLVSSFEDTDRRKDFFLTKYFNTQTQDTTYLFGSDRTACLKFTGDPDGVGHGSGCDDPIIRYADILLSRAEALNEMNGPSEEAVELVNLVRKRAGASEATLSQFSTKEDFRDMVLLERIKELYLESKRREDLIRHDRFISGAIARGKDAKDYQVRFPIPQAEIDANPMLEQNPGY